MSVQLAKLFRVFKLMAVVLLLSACSSEPVPWGLIDITGYRPQLTFNMVNADTTKPVQAEDFHGQVTVLNFGFTHCSDVCPISLHQMNAALAKMGEAAQKVAVLFVTVDPKRDTLDVLKTYTDSFGPQTIGLRGEQTEIDDLTQRYRVSLKFETPDAEGNYEVFHGSGMTVFDKQGKARLLIRPDDSADKISQDLLRLIDEPALAS